MLKSWGFFLKLFLKLMKCSVTGYILPRGRLQLRQGETSRQIGMCRWHKETDLAKELMQNRLFRGWGEYITKKIKINEISLTELSVSVMWKITFCHNTIWQYSLNTCMQRGSICKLWSWPFSFIAWSVMSPYVGLSRFLVIQAGLLKGPGRQQAERLWVRK